MGRVIHLRTGTLSKRSQKWKNHVTNSYDAVTMTLVKELFKEHKEIGEDLVIAGLLGVSHSLALIVKTAAASFDDPKRAEISIIKAISDEARKIIINSDNGNGNEKASG